MQGKVVNQTRTDVQIEVDGKVLTIPKTDIAELNLKDTPKPDIKKDPIKKPEKEITPEPEPPVGDRWYNKQRWSYSLRSAVVPGWGIWKGDRKYLAAGTFVLVSGLAYATLKTQADFSSAKNDYQTGATNYFAFALSDPTLSLPANTTTRLIGAFLVNKGAFNHYQGLAAEGNQYQYVIGLAYGLQLLYSYYLGLQAERASGISSVPPPGFKFSLAPSYQPMIVGGNGLGWTGEVRYDIQF